MNRCIFCDIIAGKSEAAFVYRDKKISAFMDIRPINSGHLIIVPNTHAEDLSIISESTGARMFNTARLLATAIKASGIRCEGINLFLADGKAAGQEIFHIHLHVIPRFRNDGFKLKFDTLETSLSNLRQTAELIQKHL